MAEPIAIVGSSCRFPGSSCSPSQLWELLKNPRDILGEFPSDRLNLENFYNQDGSRPGRTDVEGNRSYLLSEDCRVFDAGFFRINNKEAHGMDPQQRILLETVFEATESAGWPLEQMEGSSTAVYVGAMTADYNDMQMRDPETLHIYAATGVARSILANRISYCFDLRGPSVTIDTACSSSLAALHYAVQGLRAGEADAAVVAGTALLLDPAMYIAESKLHMLSPDARSRMWDSKANGYARGEGCAVVILKPLSRAVQDNDHIECVIRETCVGSDGRTNGITMPNSSAQAQLIRRAYMRAGLDPIRDRCQYFECHGTGTLVGDPAEARAIKEAFFPSHPHDGTVDADDKSPLYCGSIKTVIGHLEGCAGLAGIIKASLAMQNAAIPPNMHFEALNPVLEPYYDNLCVPTSLTPWPETGGEVRRASVNSFGFGGTNAHAILESPPPISTDITPSNSKSEKLIGPFVFSAKTSASLAASLRHMAAHIVHNPGLDLDALSWVLHTRRTALPIRIAIEASDRNRLLQALEKQVNIAAVSPDALFGVRSPATGSGGGRKLLGVFTGQGAQWALMGQELVIQSPLFRATLEECERALSTLSGGPSWSLMGELATAGTDARGSQAHIAQPLSVALQIALVDLLRASGIQFDAVVGHSSGEIGAAYAAGVLTSRDAIGIAYYRGLVAHQMMENSDERQHGAMMAVGISYQAATVFCSQPQFDGRISVAACNAPTVVTLSGDIDAIHGAKTVFDDDKVFARLLKVDTAYHSHHMARCAEAYMGYLRAMDIKPQRQRDNVMWLSSVQGHTDTPQRNLEDIKGSYWVDNMLRVVLFTQALESTMIQNDAFAAVLEVGPHPALKGPVGQTLKALGDFGLPYAGCLQRGKSDIESLSAALGMLWSHVSPSLVNFDGWRSSFHRQTRPQVLKGLPSYAWDHSQVYWHEPRLSREFRLGTSRPHELLGRLQQDWPSEMTWRNVFRPSDMPWLRGHMFQGQVIFPAAGYVSLAVQAAQVFSRGRSVVTVEVCDVSIAKALVISDDGVGVETLFTIRSHSHPHDVPDGSVLEADFTCHSCIDGRKVDMSCGGHLLIHLGQSKLAEIPQQSVCEDELPPLDVERFFTTLSALGITYDGVFRALHSISRIWGIARATASWEDGDLDRSYSLHPAILDVAFQTGFATFASIAHKSMGSTYLPAGIRRVVVDLTKQHREPLVQTKIGIDAYLVRSSSTVVEVDIHAYDQASHISNIQIDGLVLRAIAESQACDDRRIFAKTVWEPDVSCGFPDPTPVAISEEESQSAEAAERTALFFLHSLEREIRSEEVAGLKWHHQALLHGIQLLLDPVRQGHHPVLKREWLEDSREKIQEVIRRFPDSVDIALLTAVGENLPSVLRGESQMLEHMLKDNLLSRLYSEGRGFAACNKHVAEFMRHISHKHPRLNILELGAGTGGTTRRVLDAIGDTYVSYTYTDISAGFFEKAASNLADQGQKVKFKTLNIELRPSDQGFKPEYDVVVAANILHATRRLAETVQHARSLLRPGGFMIAVEVTGTMLREAGLMGGLEGWWLGIEDGRFPSPGISATAWDQLLRANGFSGVDSIIYDMPDISRHNCSVFVTQAVDEPLTLLRDPLAPVHSFPVPEAQILIIGGRDLAVSKAARRVTRLLRRFTPLITAYTSLEDFDPSKIAPGTSVLSLTELDEAIFAPPLTPTKLENLQELFGNAANVLWVTSGAFVDDPYQNMMVGIGRALAQELPHVQMQFLSFDQPSSWDMDTVAQVFLQMILLSSPKFKSVQQDFFWIQEPEIRVKGGTTLIPRLVPDHALNEGLNATRRRITRHVAPSERIDVSYASSTPSIIKSSSPTIPQDAAQMDVELSVAMHSRGENPRFLCFGRVQETGGPALSLSETNSSVVVVGKGLFFEVPSAVRGNQCDAKTLPAVGAHLIASHILSNSPEEGTILVHEPDECVAESITKAVSSTRRVIFIAAASKTGRLGWVAVHPLAQTRTIRSLIPFDASALWCFSDTKVDNILELLSEGCVARRFEPRLISGQRSSIAAALDMARSASFSVVPEVLNIRDVCSLKYEKQKRLSHILEWQRTTPLSAVIQPVDTRSAFAADKTYLLVGMTGELGQSLCRFMVRSGARHIVLASRNPVSDAKWLKSLRQFGVDVRSVKMDVTDRQQVCSTAAMIRETMPAISGVANAALILEDSLFVNTTVGTVEAQLKPKVDGTINLDEEFQRDALDFFILFSSLGTVYGNPGQAIYHAANMFMEAFAAKRQQKGQAASVVNVGMISDVGYVAKNQRASNANLEQHLRSQFYTPLSETEFHHLFAQAIQRGRPGSESEQLTMGVEQFIDDPDATERPPWYRNPLFSHMIVSPASSNGSTLQPSASQHVCKRLEEASCAVEAAEAFQMLFRLKLESMMQTPAASIDMTGPLSDLGLDSLLAVEIRTWLLKEVGVEVPLLGILGGESILSITPQVVQRFAKEGEEVAEAAEVCRSKSTVPAARIEEDTIAIGKLHPQMLRDSQSNTMHDSAALESESSHSEDVETGSRTTYSGTTTPSENTALSEPAVNGLGLQDRTNLVLSDLENFGNALSERLDYGEYTNTEQASSSQASLHFLDSFLDDPTTFNVTAHYAIKGHLNVGRFSRALQKTIARHEAYRTCFFTKPGGTELHQGTVHGVSDGLLTQLYSTSTDLQDIFQTLSQHQWNLTNGHTFHAVLVTHAPESHSLLIGCHHIIMDGMSWHIFLRDLDRACRMVPFDTSPVSNLEFSCRQTTALEDGLWEESAKYWLQQLDPTPDILPLMPLAQTRHRSPQRTYKNHTVQRDLGISIADGIKLASQAYQATPMQFHLGVIQTIFARVLELEDICIGVAHTGRASDSNLGPSALDNTIGHFTNLLPMRFRIDRETPFAELLCATSKSVLNGLSHAQIPFGHILERLGVQRSAAHTPLFQVALNYRVGDLLQRGLGNCAMELVRYSDAKTPYDLTFTVTQTAQGGQLVEVASNAYLYSEAATATIMDAYIGLIQSFALDQSQKIKDCIPYHHNGQAGQAPSLGQGPQTQNPWPETLIERFQQVCDILPDAIAIRDGERSVTYSQLACRVSAIAAVMMRENLGIRRGARVAVLCEPSVDTYVAFLGILHVGGIYVPIDPSLPTARKRSILEACGPVLLLFHGATTDSTRQFASDLPMLNISSLPQTCHEEIIPESVAGDEALLLFTSGSTGAPKGIRLTQSGIMNYAAGKQAALSIGSEVKVLQQSSPGFDMSVAQTVNAIANGGTLVIAPAQSRGDPVAIANLMVQESVNFTICTPSEYMMLAAHAADTLRHCTAWRHACSGGEALTDGLVAALRRLGLANLTLTDCYGPTEVSCAVTLQSMSIQTGIHDASVGRAIPNTWVYILDENGRMLPAGFPGEIYIGGRGVAKGYLDKDLSATRFVRDPFAAVEVDDPGRFKTMYKTGDKGCLREDGSLIFLGRIDGDSLVKLRGFRVELDEVANAVLQAAQGTLCDAVITLRGMPEFLVAHVVPARDEHPTQSELDELCASLPLPRYMIPSIVLAVDRLPTTMNGKVDRRGVAELPLPTPGLQHRGLGEDILSVAEGELRILWIDILGEAAGASRIVPDTDFFMVGGSSLLLVRLQDALKERMGVRMALHELYQASTLRSMAAAASRERGRVAAETIDWAAETAIPDHVLEGVTEEAASPTPRKTQRHVLLTGATGFLGSEILAALLDDTKVARVHCIAVPMDQQHKVSSDGRITIYPGSLSSATLGLSPLELSALQPLIDQIIHAGSQGHCLNNYSSVRSANYLSTQFLTRFALPRRIPLHFISSPRVILFSHAVEAPPVSMAAHPPPTDGAQGFTASKWASENFLEAVARRVRDLPVVLHRPCSVVGARAPIDDAMNAVVNHSRLAGCVPDVPGAEGFFDFRDAPGVAAEIVRGSVGPAAPVDGAAEVVMERGVERCLQSFRHYSSGVRVPFGQLARRMEALYGGRFETVSLAEWIRIAVGLGIESVIVSYLEANVAGAVSLSFPYMGASIG